MSNEFEARLNSRMGRRSFMRRTRTFIVGGSVVLGLTALGIELVDGRLFDNRSSYLSDDQIAAKLDFDEAERAKKLLFVEIVNPDETGGPVTVRKNPAIHYDNELTKIKPNRRYEGILVDPVSGLQQTDPELSGLWVGIKLLEEDDKIGFIHNKFADRVDGHFLTDGQKIYDLRPQEADILSPIDSR